MPELLENGHKDEISRRKLSTNALERRRTRSRTAMAAMRETDPARHALMLRRGIRRLLTDANTTSSPMIRIECIGAACRAIGTFLDIISHPKRPPAVSATGLRPVMDLELPADLVQMAEESTPLDSTEPETR